MSQKTIHFLANKKDIVDYALSPVLFNKTELLNRGYKIKVFYREKKIFDCDTLCLISKPVIGYLQEKSEIFQENGPVIQFIKKTRKYVDNIIWMDDSDSTSVTHFELMPYIDKYLKKQLFRDYSLYRKNLYGGRLFSDFYHNNFNITDNNEFSQYYPLNKEYESKVDLSWNIGLGNVYDAFTMWTKLKKYLSYSPKVHYNYSYVNPDHNRTIDVFLRTSTNLSRETIAFHRKELVARLDSFNKSNINITGVIGKNIYNAKNIQLLKRDGEKRIPTSILRDMMSSTKIMPSPFGWGEIGARDYEAFIHGAVLFKPDLSHMKTWPNIFLSNETYIPFKWDFSDLNENIENILSNENLGKNIAFNGQERYKSSISKQGMLKFCDWFEKQIGELH